MVLEFAKTRDSKMLRDLRKLGVLQHPSEIRDIRGRTPDERHIAEVKYKWEI
jgi:hypothetical protein